MHPAPLLLALLAPLQDATQDDAAAGAPWRIAPPAETFEVVRVVDGDTLHILRGSEREKLRLLSVDTEEKLELGTSLSATKPGTVFGDESTAWAQEFFAAQAQDGANPRIGLRFPGGREARDVYGRLLCHVVLEDGTDFNLLLVRLGKSPYFDKYGYSLIDHAAFVVAEREARAARRGIWNPETNAGSAKRPYAQLMPWWEARAQAVAGFRGRRAAAPELVVAADDPDGLERSLQASLDALDRGEAAPRIEVFGSIHQFFDEDDGSRTVLFRGGDKRRSLRVRIPAEERAAYAARDLDGTTDEFVQNYLYVAGTLARGERGFELLGVKPTDWRQAGPTPDLPADSELEEQAR